MPAQALYLKYRPRTFAEIDGQEHVTRTLRNALALGRISHAYLFTGPRGTGKTSTARILAKAVNCIAKSEDLPCNECASCRAINEERMLDLIEIDAASNTSVEDVRDLRDKVDFRPGEAKFKVYIIDEVHMLSTAAFNALLKTLEEPPPHVIFVLATTDPQKIPATVISRVQRFDFRRLALSEIIRRLDEIAKNEKIKADPAALELIARQATGAMRDAISLLDQLVSYGGDEVTLVQVQGLLGAGSHQAVSSLINSLASGDIAGGLQVIGQAVDSGADPRQIARDVVEYLRSLMLIQVGSESALTLSNDELNEMTERAEQVPPPQLLRAIRLFNQAAYDLRASANPTLPLEIALIEAMRVDNPASPVVIQKSEPEAVKQIVQASKSEKSRPVIPPKRAPKPETAAAAGGEVTIEGELTADLLRANWNLVLARVRVYDKVAEALLRSAEPARVQKDQVILGFPYELHMQRFEKEPKTKLMLEKALGDIFNRKTIVKCVLSPRKAKIKAVEEDPLIRAAVNQLGAEITDIHEGA